MIYANRISNGSGDLIQIKLQEPLQGSDVLMYDSIKKAFVNTNTVNVGSITNARNLGGTNSLNVYAGQDNTTLLFKDIIAGDGISITQDDTSLTINAYSNNNVIVPDDYKIVIGSQSLGNSKFEIWTSSGTPMNPLIIEEPISIEFLMQNVFTGNDPDFNKGYFQTINGSSFYDNGLRIGMKIEVENAGDQSGIWEIYDIVCSNKNGQIFNTMYLTEIFQGNFSYNMGGPKQSIHFISYDFYAEIITIDQSPLPSYTQSFLTSWFYDFGPDGYNIQPGMQFRIINSESHDGVYLVKSVISKGINQLSQIILDDNYQFSIPGMIKPNNSSINVQLIFDSTFVKTGFGVDQHGNVSANNITAQNISTNDPQNPSEVATKNYVDEMKISKSKQFFMSFLN